jgi:DNA helicase-2/ATP-dependent DNA helicase PcrA
MTSDAVLLILSENRIGRNIGFDDFIPPSVMPSEKQRLVYVAISRPQKLLCLGLPDTIPEADLKARFGNNIVIM